MNVQETLELVKKSQQTPSETLAKVAGFLQSASAISGLTAYDLEAPAKTLYPVLTPLRNSIPRVTGGLGIQANWRVVTGINTDQADIGVSEGNCGSVTSHTTADKLAAFKGFGLEDYVTFEAEYAGKSFDDVKARAVQGVLRSLMIGEEMEIVGGNSSLALGSSGVCTTPTVALNTDSTSTGLDNGTLLVKAVALGHKAYWKLAGLNNGSTGSSIGLTIDPNDKAVCTKVNGDGTSETYNGNMSAISSASSGVTIDASHKSAGAYVTAIPGAVGYAWYWSANGGTYYLGAITTVNHVKIDANPTTTIAVGSNLNTRHDLCSLEFDGLLAQGYTTASGAYVKHLAVGTPGTGTQLTSDGAGGISQLNDLFVDRWNLFKLGMDEIQMNAQQLLDINQIIIKNGGAPLIRFNVDGTNPAASIVAGTRVEGVMNPVTGQRVKFVVHPNMSPGTMLGRCTELPYSLSGVVDVCRMLMRQDYYQLEWPRTTRKYRYGVYADGVLQHYFPPALAIIDNIMPGHA